MFEFLMGLALGLFIATSTFVPFIEYWRGQYAKKET